MATRYTELDIIRLIREAQKGAEPDDGEKQGNFTTNTSVTPFVGRKKNVLGITPGFKLKHKTTGLTYTVKQINLDERDVIMTVESGDGKSLSVTSKDFKNYERL